jgi:hypothetical protein
MEWWEDIYNRQIYFDLYQGREYGSLAGEEYTIVSPSAIILATKPL